MEEEIVIEEWFIYQYDTTMFSTDILPTTESTRQKPSTILIAAPMVGVVVFIVMIVLCAVGLCLYQRRKSQYAIPRRTAIEMAEVAAEHNGKSSERFASTTWPSLHHEKPAANYRVDIRTYFDVNMVKEHAQPPEEHPSIGERTPSSGKRKLSMLMRLITGLAQRPGSRSSLSSLSSSHNNMCADQGTGRKKKATSTSGLDDLKESNENFQNEDTEGQNQSHSTSGLEDSQESNPNNMDLAVKDDFVFVSADDIDWSSMYF
ncbi:uncharacterized protein [Amphiura filiformis]|uniref:uncharacterized protein n=1 Tax=Amphiura filiformis TaxID=82378 RepID=UPI003B2145BB